MSRQKEQPDWVTVLAAALLCLFFGLLIGAGCATEYAHNRAVANGAGRWTVNEKTGNRTFVYGR